MALFSKKTAPAKKKASTKVAKTPRVVKQEVAPVVAGISATSATSYAHVLKNPRITEKATVQSEQNVITFDVAVATNKREVIKAVQSLYKVTPVAVRMVTVRAKMRKNARTGRLGMTNKGKKAYVQLKKGDSITLV